MRISDWSSDVCSSDLQDEDNIPAASGSPDASLTQADSFTATSHAGLTYPWGEAAPGPGETIRIADGYIWGRRPMPGSDRRSVVSGQSVSVRVDCGGSGFIKRKQKS